MNNKGFTLVEILSVLILIGLLIGIGIPGVSRISNNMKQKSLNTKIKLVEEAGVFWGQDNKSLLQTDKECQTNDGKVPCKKISVNQLISEGYLDSESRDVIQYDNPLDNNSMLANSVYVYKKNNRVYAFYSNELLIQIISSDDIKSGNWHNTDFTLTILGSGKITYSWDNKNYNNEYTGPILVNISTNSRMLYVKLVNGVQQNEMSYEVKLDKTIPYISMYKIFYDQVNNIATLSGKATDDSLITGYKYTTDSTCTSGSWTTVSTSNLENINKNYTISNVRSNKYYFCVKDNSGKISSLDADLNINLTSTDSISSGAWHNNNFKINISGTGTKSCKYNGVNKSCNEEITSSSNPSTFLATLQDGNKINEMNYLVRLDKIPTISDYKISYNTGNSIATLRGIATDDINISQYKFTTDSTCNSGTWQNKSSRSIDVSHTFSNVSEQNRNYYFCVKDSKNQIKSSSALYPANCIVTGNFSCNETCLWSSKCPEYYFNLTGRSDNLTVQIHVPDEDSSLILNTGSINNFKIKESSIFYECDKNQVYITVYDKYSNTCFYHRNNDSNWDF